MISAVAQKYNIHPQTLRLYEREGLLKPSRTEGNTRLYSEEDLEQLETILSLTRDLGVNLAGVEIILNMRRKIERMQREVNEFMEYVQARAGARHRRLGAAAVHRAREVDADRSRAREPAESATPRSRKRKKLKTDNVVRAKSITEGRMLGACRARFATTPAGSRSTTDGVRRVVRCDCWRESVGQQRLADANIPPRYQHCTLDNFTAYNESLERAAAGAAARRTRFRSSARGLFLEGQPGVARRTWRSPC